MTQSLYLLGAIAFVLISLTIGSQIRKQWGKNIHNFANREPLKLVPVVVCVLFAMMAMANAVHLESIAGAVLAGILLGRSGFMPTQVRKGLSPLVNDVLCPIFFATAGLKVDLRAFGSIGPWIAVIVAVAVASKYIGVASLARAGRLSWRSSFAFASALNARGAVEVIIAAGGLAVGILSQQAYSAIVIMAMVTSVMAAPLLVVLAVDDPQADRDCLGLVSERASPESQIVDRSIRVTAGANAISDHG
jgi:Kef-type K+ transport system membrane component KefB